MASSKQSLVRRRWSWRYIGMFLIVISATATGAFFLTRHLLSSGGDVTAQSPVPEEDATDVTRKEALDKLAEAIAADQAKPRFTGELGDYFYIAAPELDAVPPELSTMPYSPESCGDDFVPVTAADTTLYFELPTKVDSTEVTPTGPPHALVCGGEVVSVEQVGNIQTDFGVGTLSVVQGLFYHDRDVFSFNFSRERYELTEIAGKPAVVIRSLGLPDLSHVRVIVQPYREGVPGIAISLDGDLTGAQAIALAEQVVAGSGQ